MEIVIRQIFVFGSKEADQKLRSLKQWIRSFDGVPEEEAAAPRKNFEDRIKLIRAEALLLGIELTE